MQAIEALRHYMPGCEGVRLRNFGMTIGIRDTRKIDASYNMTEADVRAARAASTTRSASTRNSSTATAC